MNSRDESPETNADELKRLEQLLLEPEFRRDSKRVEELLAEDFLEFGSSGRVWTRETTLQLLATESYIKPIIEDFACRMLSNDVTLLTYRSLRTGADDEQHVETLRSSIWMRRNGKWKIIFHQGTRTLQS